MIFRALQSPRPGQGRAHGALWRSANGHRKDQFRISVLVPEYVAPKCDTRGNLEEKPKNNLLFISGLRDAGESMAGRQGFEPRLSGPEPPVLPLDDLPAALRKQHLRESICEIQVAQEVQGPKSQGHFCARSSILLHSGLGPWTLAPRTSWTGNFWL